MRFNILSRILKALRSRRLQAQYAAAYEEWEASGEAALWEVTVGDGIEDEDWSELSEVNER